MEKYILVPYEKYQRMLRPKTKGFGEVKEDDPSTKVSLPPPGERKRKKTLKNTGKAQKRKIDWISF